LTARAKISTFKVEVTAVDGVPQSAIIRLPRHGGIQYSATWSEAELWRWIRSTIKQYVRREAGVAAQRRSRSANESR